MTLLEIAIKQLEMSAIQHNILSSLILTIKKAVEQYFADNQQLHREK